MIEEPKEFIELIECWQSLPRTAGNAPRKSAFSPARIPRLLPHLYLIERTKPNNICIRLIGSELESVFGSATTGTSMFDSMISDEWDYYERVYSECAENVCAGRIKRSVSMGTGLMLEVESLCVPLADNDDNPCFILGVMVMKQSRDLSVKAHSGDIPKNQILRQRFVDLGTGIPDDVPPPPSLENVAPFQFRQLYI